MEYYEQMFTAMFVLLPALLLTFISQISMALTYAKHAKKKNPGGLSASAAAEKVLKYHKLPSEVHMIEGNMIDKYDIKTDTVNLTSAVHKDTSMAAVCVAVHECAHAVQTKKGNTLLKIRDKSLIICNVLASLAWILILIGLFYGSDYGTMLFNVGVAFYLIPVVFFLICLPMEIGASQIAKKDIEALKIYEGDDLKHVEKCLGAAAMFYMGSLSNAFSNIFRFAMYARLGLNKKKKKEKK